MIPGNKPQQAIRQIRWLTQALILSATLNIGLLATFFYLVVRDRPSSATYELKPATKEQQASPVADSRSNSEVLRSFKGMPFGQLVIKLQDSRLVEDGYSQRDLALAALVTYHHFNITEALPGQVMQQRQLTFDKEKDPKYEAITIFPGLSNQQYESLIHYINAERWPLTSKGLFLELKKENLQGDSSLAEAFFLTPEFIVIEVLFSRSEVPVQKEELLALVREGDWQMLADFTEQQRVSQDLSSARRHRFLLDYIGCHSQKAAYLMLKTDGSFAAKKLNNSQVMNFLQLLDTPTKETHTFAQELLTSPRSDEVWKMAAARLYDYAKEPMPAPYSHMAALTKFIPEEILAEKVKHEGAEIHETRLAANSKMHVAKLSPIAAVTPIATPPTAPPIKALQKKPQKETTLKEITQKEPAKPKEKPSVQIHIAQTGDTLPKLAKQYQVNVATLKKLNRLTSDNLKPGTALKVPLR